MWVRLSFCIKLRHPQKMTRQMLLATILLGANCSLRKKTLTLRRKAYEHRDVGIQIQLNVNQVHRRNQLPTVGSVVCSTTSVTVRSLTASITAKLIQVSIRSTITNPFCNKPTQVGVKSLWVILPPGGLFYRFPKTRHLTFQKHNICGQPQSWRCP